VANDEIDARLVGALIAALESASAKFREFLPMEQRYLLGLAPRPSGFRLGCENFPRNPFYLLVCYADGLGFKMGLRGGDTIVGVEGRKFAAKDSLEDFKLVIKANLGQTLKVIVERDGKQKTLPLKIPKEIPKSALYIP
jgi:hypothetical protein